MATYEVHDYARMVADGLRLQAYAEALRRTVRPGSVVVDIGAGTGILTLLACRYGARRVYAIEPNESISIAKELVAENGFSERVELVREDARSVVLPERADVVVSDLRGTLPPYGDHLEVIAYAREHFLAPGGALVPQSDRLVAAVAECPGLYEDALGPASGPEGLTFGAVRGHLANCMTSDRRNPLRPENLITEAAVWAELDYRSIIPGTISGRARWVLGKGGTGHGLALWFEATLAEGVHGSSRPGLDAAYARAFLPWTRPLELRAGDTIAVDLWCQAQGDPWGWTTTVDGAGGAGLTLRQSTFLAALSAPARTGPRSHCGDRLG